MSLYLRMAWRNVWRHKLRTVIIVIAIGFTLALMLLYQGLIVGFEQAIYGNAIQLLGGNIQIHAQGFTEQTNQNPLIPLQDDQEVIAVASKQPQVVTASRRIITGGLVSSHKGAFGVSIVGVEPEKEQQVNLVAQTVAAGRYLKPADQDNIFIGRGLADALDIRVGERIILVGRTSHNQMRRRTMTVVGIYDVGLPDVEKRTVYISLNEAQELYGLPGQSTEVMVSLQKLGQEDAVIAAIQPQLVNYEIDTWKTSFPELEQTIAMKSAVMDMFGIILFLISGIGILNLLMMAVYERSREIGVLGALGLKARQITLLFLLEGALIGLVGVAFGVVLGVGINFLLGYVGIDFSQFTSITEYTALISGRIYPTLGLEKLPQYTITAVVIAVLAAYYPAYEAAHKEPAKALHFV